MRGGGGDQPGGVLAVVAGKAGADDPELGVRDRGPGGEELGVALVADQAGHDDGDGCGCGRAEGGADAGAGFRVRVEAGGVPAIADGGGAGVDAEAAGVGGFLRGHGEEGPGPARGGPFHEEGQGAAGRGAGLVEEEAVACVGDVGDAGDAGGEAGEEAADGHVGVDDVGPFRAEQGEEGAERAELGARAEGAGHGDGDDAQAAGADVVQQGTVGAHADHLVTPGGTGLHEGEEEVAEGEVHVGDFEDLHGGPGLGGGVARFAGPPPGVQAAVPILVMAHFTCWGPSA